MLLLLALPICLGAIAQGASNPALPYDRTNPVLYDNDAANDVYTEEYVLALNSLGEIRLLGLLTSSSITPFNRFVSPQSYEAQFAEGNQLALYASASGFANIPPRIRGPKGNLVEPPNQIIENTQPIGSDGSWLIVTEARKATPQKPLVVVVGGPLTAEADAYLLDPSIADRLVIAWIGGRAGDMGDYNGWADPWAAYICMRRLRLIQFTAYVGRPNVQKWELLSLPQSSLRDYMYAKQHPNGIDPGNWDTDGPPAISLTRPDFPLEIKRVSFDGWVSVSFDDPHTVPKFRDDPAGTMQVVTNNDAIIASNEWWRALRAAFTTNSAPTISAISDQSINADTVAGPLMFSIADAETSPGSLTVSGVSSNPTLVPNTNITFGGSGTSRTVTITPAAGRSGTATITITISDPGRSASRSFQLTVAQTSATVSLSNLSPTYDGSPKPVTVTTNPVGLSTAVTYNGAPSVPTAAGDYTVVATITDPNYSASATGTLRVGKAPTTVSLSGTSRTFNGSPKSVSATTVPAGLGTTITYDGSTSPPTNAGSYAVVATVTDANYTGSASGSLSVAKAVAGISFGNITQAYNGSPRPVSVTTNPAGLVVTTSYNGNSTAPTAAGTYVVSTTVNDNNYTGDATASLLIHTVNLAGVYFGAFGTNNGAWGLSVNCNLTGTFVGFDETSGTAYVSDVAFTPDGNFSGTGSASNASTPAIQRGNSIPANISGRIVAGSVNGGFNLPGVSFQGASTPATGPTANLAGLYIASGLNLTQGTMYVVADASGHAGVVILATGFTAAGFGTVTPKGTLSLPAHGATSLDVRIAPANGSISAQILPYGATAFVTFAGLVDDIVTSNLLINLSTRGFSGANDALIIAGFVIAGSGTKNVLVRAVGPTLANAPYNVAGVLTDPKLVLHDKRLAIAENDDWRTGPGTAGVQAAIDSTGAFPLPEGSKDAALVLTLPAGQYTALVSGSHGETGIAIAEIYDIPGGTTANARLVNISTRGFVGIGDALMIPGFVSTGNAPRRYLVRAVGPTLAASPYNVPGVLSDPLLEVIARGQTTPLATNDDWDVGGAGEAVATEAAAAGAFPLPRGSKDAAIIVTLLPDTPYTILVRGKNSATGVAIAEVYELAP